MIQLKAAPPEAARGWRRARVMPPSYGADREHAAGEEPSQRGSRRDGHVEWDGGRKTSDATRIQSRNRQEVELGRSRKWERNKNPTQLKILLWRFLPTGVRWVINKKKTIKFTSINPKIFWDRFVGWLLETQITKHKPNFLWNHIPPPHCTNGPQLCNAVLNIFCTSTHIVQVSCFIGM